MTPQEARLWLELRALRTFGFHFRRQAPFRGYYLDFVCFNRRLVVEVDGGAHTEEGQAAHDALRDAVLRRQGFRTLRVWNSDVTTNLDDVMTDILTALRSPPSPLWAGTDEAQPRQGGAALILTNGRKTSTYPTLAASPPVPPHDGEGGDDSP